MIQSLLELGRNQRTCILTEPLWSIPYNLYLPFISVFLLALGASDRQVGMVASITLFVRTCTALLAGSITDKLGRRITTVIFDTLSWSIPAILWMTSQNVYWFMAGAAINGFFQIPDISWSCTLVEDAENEQMVTIYSWIHLIAQVSIFFAPLSALLVVKLGIVMAMRIMYGFTFISMTCKFIIMFLFTEETTVGQKRMNDTKGMSILKIMSGYKEIIPRFFTSRETVFAAVVATLFTITTTVMDNFFGIYSTQRLGLPQHYLAFLPIIRSLTMLLFIFFFQPRIARFGYKGPMLIGIIFYIVGHLALIFLNAGTIPVIVTYYICVAIAHGLVIPRRDSLAAVFMEPQERARMSSIRNMVVLGISIPFGYIAGVLSDHGRHLPFLLNITIFVIAFVLIACSRSLSKLSLESK